ncbi:unnamed protein product [Acanthosepion pharaonis]|uniref:Uncharacterized protein n=1 Tax=Acanthosepion pharaonis TaxID=158019 RepID=A0A812DI62_ACAPH|nr:unnamed protein product [Sepia pharaonis]
MAGEADRLCSRRRRDRRWGRAHGRKKKTSGRGQADQARRKIVHRQVSGQGVRRVVTRRTSPPSRAAARRCRRSSAAEFIIPAVIGGWGGGGWGSALAEVSGRLAAVSALAADRTVIPRPAAAGRSSTSSVSGGSGGSPTSTEVRPHPPADHRLDRRCQQHLVFRVRVVDQARRRAMSVLDLGARHRPRPPRRAAMGRAAMAGRPMVRRQFGLERVVAHPPPAVPRLPGNSTGGPPTRSPRHRWCCCSAARRRAGDPAVSQTR